MLFEFLIVTPLIGILLNCIALKIGPNIKVVRALSLVASIVPLLSLTSYWSAYYVIKDMTDMLFSVKYLTLKLDKLSMLFVLLTALLVPLSLLAEFRKKEIAFFNMILLLESILMILFTSTNILVFYMFLEFSIIPIFILIRIWGGKNRIYASLKFLLYTVFGSLFMLGAVLYIVTITESYDMLELRQIIPNYTLSIQKVLWLLFFVSFAVKIPMIPFHTWLPRAHVEAPTGVSMLLAGVMLKVGGYAMIRIMYEMLPEASKYFQNLIFVLSVIGIIYGSLLAYVQKDIKPVIAYSSIAHMGFITEGIFAGKIAMSFALFHMFSHGLVSSGLFFSVGVLYKRFETKRIEDYGGLGKTMKLFSIHFFILILAAIGLPGSIGFIGEFFIILNTFKINPVIASIMALSIILSAAYMMPMFNKIVFGEEKKEFIRNRRDLVFSENIIMLVINIIVIVLGLYPNLLMNIIKDVC